LSGMNLNGFNFQNVISGLEIENLESGFRIGLRPCFGLAGTMDAEKISIRLMPGTPEDSQYK
jgi:hypothetical protein